MVDDARSRTIVFIEAYDTPANITKDDDATAALIINQYENPPYPIIRVVFDPKNVDGIRTILTPSSRALYDWKGEIYAYEETVPIELDAFTKQGITADKLRWKMELDLRNSCELYSKLGATGYGSAVRLINRVVPLNRPFGRLKHSSVRYDLAYKRSDDNYASDVTISYGSSYMQDFDFNLYTVVGSYVADAGGDVTHTVSSDLTQVDDYWNGYYIVGIRCFNDSVIGLIRLITDFDDATDTITQRELPAAIIADDIFKILQPNGWEIVEDGQTVSPPTNVNNILALTVTASAGNEAAYYVNTVNLGLSSTVYPKIRFRYKTSDTNIKAKIIIEFNDASTQEILADSSSTTWVVADATITSAKTIDHIRLHADHATGTVYYDWLMIYTGDFVFPNVVDLRAHPTSRNVNAGIASGMVLGNQNLGADPETIEIDCDLDMETASYDWTRAGDTDKDEIFHEIIHNQKAYPWQWLVYGNKSMRVTIDGFPIKNREGMLTLMLREYSDSDKSDETYNERWNI